MKSVSKFPAAVLRSLRSFAAKTCCSVTYFLTHEWPQEIAKNAKENTVFDHGGSGGGLARNAP
jgi:hypothetical protein